MESEIEKRDSALFNYKEISSHLRDLGYPETAINLIEKCGTSKHQFMTVTCGCGTRAVELKNSCNKRFCAICSEKRKKRLRKRLLPYLKAFPNNAKYQFRFLTISPLNYDDLEKGIKDIRKSFNKFLRRKYISERIKGGFHILECKESKNNTWNVHIHSIIYSRHLDHVCRGKCSCGQSYLKYDRTSKKFYCANKKCNKIYEGIVFESRLQREFSESSKRTCVIDVSRISRQSSVINYCLKYVSVEKGEFSSVQTLALYIKTTYKERMINSFGEFYDFKKLKPLPNICRHCHQVMKFDFDLEVSNLILQSYSHSCLDPNLITTYLET